MSLYARLGVPRNATLEQIKQRYRVLALQFHPDRNGPEMAQKFKEITEAYNILKDSKTRAQYDMTERAAERPYSYEQQSAYSGGYHSSNSYYNERDDQRERRQREQAQQRTDQYNRYYEEKRQQYDYYREQYQRRAKAEQERRERMRKQEEEMFERFRKYRQHVHQKRMHEFEQSFKNAREEFEQEQRDEEEILLEYLRQHLGARYGNTAEFREFIRKARMRNVDAEVDEEIENFENMAKKWAAGNTQQKKQRKHYEAYNGYKPNPNPNPNPNPFQGPEEREIKEMQEASLKYVVLAFSVLLLCYTALLHSSREHRTIQQAHAESLKTMQERRANNAKNSQMSQMERNYLAMKETASQMRF